MSLNIDPNLFRYNAKSRQAGLKNGHYTAFPRMQKDGKFKSSHIRMTDETLALGYVFFPGLRVAVAFSETNSQGQPVPDWWSTKPQYLFVAIVKLISESVKKQMNEIAYAEIGSVSPWLAIVDPRYASSFANAINTLASQSGGLSVEIARFMGAALQNLNQYVAAFKKYDADKVKDEVKKAVKAMSLQDAYNQLAKIHGFAKAGKPSKDGKGNLVVMGVPKKSSKKAAAKGAVKVAYSPSEVARITAEGKWLDISKATVGKSGGIKDIHTLQQKQFGPHTYVYRAMPGKPQYNLLYNVPVTHANDPEAAAKAQSVAASVNLFVGRLGVKQGEDFEWVVSGYDAVGPAPQIGTTRQANPMFGGVLEIAPQAPGAPTALGQPAVQVPALPSQPAVQLPPANMAPAVQPAVQNPFAGNAPVVSTMPGMSGVQIASSNALPAPPVVGAPSNSPPQVNAAALNF